MDSCLRRNDIRKIALIVSALIFLSSNAIFAFTDPQKLEPGKTYRLSRPTILYPKKEIPKTLDELKDTKKAPREGTIKILKVVVEDDRTLYFVLAENRKGDSIAKGWVASQHLVGQSLDMVSDKKSDANNHDAIRLMRTVWGDKLR